MGRGSTGQNAASGRCPLAPLLTATGGGRVTVRRPPGVGVGATDTKQHGTPCPGGTAPCSVREHAAHARVNTERACRFLLQETHPGLREIVA